MRRVMASNPKVVRAQYPELPADVKFIDGRSQTAHFSDIFRRPIRNVVNLHVWTRERESLKSACYATLTISCVLTGKEHAARHLSAAAVAAYFRRIESDRRQVSRRRG
jgi:hypothetical protein